MPGPQLTTAEAIKRNLKALMERRGFNQPALAKKSGVSQRYISDLLSSADKQVSVEVLQKLAKPFGLQGWQLQMPDLPVDLLDSDIIGRVVRDLANANSEGRDLIARTAEREAAFSRLPPAPSDDTT